MNWAEGAVLGLVQGLTEFLPVSSSAHLRVVAALAGWDDPGAAFTAVTQLGTAAAVMVYLRADIARLGRAWLRSLAGPVPGQLTALGARPGPEMRPGSGSYSNPAPDPALAADARLTWLIIFGTVPIGAVGYLFEDVIKGRFRDLRLTAGALVGVGALLGAADSLTARRAARGGAMTIGGAPRGGRPLAELSVRDGLLIGLAQAAALVPGVSRSGATIGGGLLLRYSREAAARYSFLLAVPAVLVSGTFGLHRLYREVRPHAATGATGTTGEAGERAAEPAWGPLVGASVVAFVVGYAAIAWFLRYVSAHGFAPFVVYRIGLGLLLLALVLGGRIPATPA
ncbi:MULTISPECIES: undecaprenyl-diphosphate phosphatase [unclassified Parafrankia]|uniref:undecaprenyl-diphosphate phosphatase n=1 Tax=unclassified Parafrankia TaxID=2994368 RepID=UPI000DA49119|nr:MULTISPECIES: undecaprenyl-diphosphate phosphatase [unclassified Parafrankia]TCJ33830.1 undecaprenyl-diphosphate phosphatase [Parafrankia sp. BMG5.11]SQD96213.1 Undecaprenyl-diphosphatase 3 [Parafrankia sp. Ea1.12]